MTFDEWRAFRDDREARLRDPHGWLAITAIHWLTSTPERFDDVPGEWFGADDTATVTLADDETLTTEAGVTMATGVHVLGPLDEDGITLSFGDAVAQVAKRDSGIIVRPRHPDSPNLTHFGGTPVFDYDPSWELRGRVEGEQVVFERDGAEHRLTAWPEDDGSLWILFRDATSGVTTYAANRQLLVDPPAADGSVTIDFNLAMNMPCAYTDFATCPLPPPENTLAVAVEAGEKTPPKPPRNTGPAD